MYGKVRTLHQIQLAFKWQVTGKPLAYEIILSSIIAYCMFCISKVSERIACRNRNLIRKSLHDDT